MIGAEPHRIAEIGCSKVIDAEDAWVTDMHWTAMHRREARRDVGGAADVGRREGPH